MELSDYEQQKFQLAEILRAALVLAKEQGQDLEAEIRELFARLAEDRFNLAVVGRFSRGKTSLMNAILNTDRLPTGIVPLTSVITSVSYGSEERVVLTIDGWRLQKDIPIDALPEYITQAGNPGNEKHIKMANIQLPSEILRRGFYFVDTPGLGSAIAENTRTTEAFLPSADAFVLVTGYESPLSDDEVRFLRGALPSARRMFVVLNKHDTIKPIERAQALDYVRQKLTSLFGDQAPSLFSTSAMEALAAKQAGDPERLETSGVGELEQALIDFLVTEKRTEFLLRMCDRIEATSRALDPSDKLTDLIERNRALSRTISGHESERQNSNFPPAILPAVRPENAGTCEICRAVDQACFDFLAEFQFDISVSTQKQRELVTRGGLCGFHTWQYSNMTSPQGTCIGFAPLLEHYATALSRISNEEEPANETSKQILALLPTHDRCIVCQKCDDFEVQAVTRVADRLRNSDDETLDALSVICLHHLPGLIDAVGNTSSVQRILKRQAGLSQAVADDMRRYAVKFDGVRRQLLSGTEERAALRGIKLVAGLEHMSFRNHLIR